jgi:hypothetical protein
VIRTVLAIAGLALLTAGCGLRGDLERPVPLWGNPPNEGPNDPRSIKAAEEEAARKKAAEDAAKKAESEQAPAPTSPN